MEAVRIFLESSTIHGLTYISTTRKYARLFWILVVIGGFVGASLLIKESFDSWSESPIKTTIETLPISEITFPKLTVCPPKNTLTDLNHELMMAENRTIDEEDKKELLFFAMDLLQDQLYEEFMFNLSIVQEENRYYNWYNGYTEIVLPRTNERTTSFEYTIRTFANSGMVFTNFFGEPLNVSKVIANLKSLVYVHVPEEIRHNKNITLHFEMEKVSLKELQVGFENYYYGTYYGIKDDRNNLKWNYTPPGPPGNPGQWGYTENDKRSFELDRLVPEEEIEDLTQNLYLFPGYKIRWFYTGLDPEFKPQRYFSSSKTRFVRAPYLVM